MTPDSLDVRSGGTIAGPRAPRQRRLPRALTALAAAALLVAACDPTTGVNSDPPVVTITAPTEQTRFEQGDTITFAGTAQDPEDGPLTGSALTWKSDLDGTLGSGEELQVAVDDMTGGSHVITLAATDSDGVTGSASVSVLVVRPPS